MITIIIPVVRLDKIERCMDAADENSGIPDNEYEILAIEDTESIGCPKMIKKIVDQCETNLVMFLGDDTIPQKDYLKNALAAMAKLPDGWGLVGLNDLQQDGRELATHWLADKRLLPLLGGEFFHTGYAHHFCDRELTVRCKEMGKYIWAKDAIILHSHPAFGGEDDEVYDLTSSTFGQDQKLFWQRRRESVGGQKLGIGIPLTDKFVHSQFLDSWVMMERPDFTYLRPMFPGNISSVRNALVEQALDQGCSHLVMMDTDQIYPPDTITKLLSHSVDVVGGKVHRRYPPFDPILYKGNVNKYEHVSDELCESGELVEVDATGCGCIMFNTKVFTTIEQPWFKEVISDCITPTDKEVIGEDIGFCSKMKEHKFDIYVDTSIDIGHLALMEINHSSYVLYKRLKALKRGQR